MSQDLVRFSVAMPEDLLSDFDKYVERRGVNANRSEVIRDLVRETLSDDICSLPGKEVMGTLSIVFNHHANDLQEKLHGIQHNYYSNIISTTHVHLDPHLCLEVIILKGATELIQEIANQIAGTKGVVNGRLNLTAVPQKEPTFKDSCKHEYSHNNQHVQQQA